MTVCCLGGNLNAQETVNNPIFSYSGTVGNVVPKEKSEMSIIKKTIDEWGQCSTGAITMGPAGACVYERRFAYTLKEVPNNMKTYMQDPDTFVQDVHITEQCNYIIVFNKNRFLYLGLPEQFKEKLLEYKRGNLENDNIRSACFNDRGDWVIVSNAHYSYSSEKIGFFLKEAVSRYGALHSVSLTNNGIIACCTSGVYYKNIPLNVAEQIANLRFAPKVIKFTDNGFFLITDGKSQYIYHL